MDEFIICKAEQADIEAACEIAVEAWTPIREVFRRELGDELYEAYFTDWQTAKKKAVTQELLSGRGYVTKQNGKVVAFISYRMEGNKGVIGTNAVSPEARGHGLGTKQYEFVFDRMREEGAEFVSVHTGGDDGHAPARRAYEKAGFQEFLPSRVYYKKL